MSQFKHWLSEIKWLNCDLCGKDFLITREKSTNKIKQILYTAEALHHLHEENISAKCFHSGLAVSLFPDSPTPYHFSFSFAANLLGLSVRDVTLDKSHNPFGKSMPETAVMISFITEIFGIGDNLYPGIGRTSLTETAAALDEAFEKGILNRRPGIINLHSDIDVPPHTLADLLHIKKHFGSLENLRGKKMAVTWAYSPAPAKSPAVPCGIVSLMSRLGMNFILAHPEGFDLPPEVTAAAQKNTTENGGGFNPVKSMKEALADADIVCPVNWPSCAVLEQRTTLLKKNDQKGLRKLDEEILSQNEGLKDWQCSPEKKAAAGKKEALYTSTYSRAEHIPFIIAAMMLNNRFPNPAKVLETLYKRKTKRVGL